MEGVPVGLRRSSKYFFHHLSATSASLGVVLDISWTSSTSSLHILTHEVCMVLKPVLFLSNHHKTLVWRHVSTNRKFFVAFRRKNKKNVLGWALLQEALIIHYSYLHFFPACLDAICIFQNKGYFCKLDGWVFTLTTKSFIKPAKHIS